MYTNRNTNYKNEECFDAASRYYIHMVHIVVVLDASSINDASKYKTNMA